MANPSASIVKAPPRATQLLAPIATLAVVLLMIVPLLRCCSTCCCRSIIGPAVVLLLTVLPRAAAGRLLGVSVPLLLLTLIRLSPNVASTRLILMHGAEGVDAAGHVIMSFGQFVVGGNFVVGIVVFVLIAIQFPRHQPRRGAHFEVTARFHPRRDARTPDGHRRRPERRHDRRSRRGPGASVRREADFYGAIGRRGPASPSDAVAAMLITGVNIVAGAIIGVFQHGARSRHGPADLPVRFVGEGLVTAIPACSCRCRRLDHDAGGLRVEPRRGHRGPVASGPSRSLRSRARPVGLPR